jgi:hypothetical protein
VILCNYDQFWQFSMVGRGFSHTFHTIDKLELLLTICEREYENELRASGIISPFI